MYTVSASTSNVLKCRTVPQATTALPVVFIATGDAIGQELASAIVDAGWRVQTDSRPLDQPNGLAPSCVIVDCGLMDLYPVHRDTPVIALAADGDMGTAVRAMKAGAFDVLAKSAHTEELITTVRNALDRSAASLRQCAEDRQLRDHYASLSQRERQVMTLVVSGLLNKQVGGELGISEITVKAHRGRVMRKMNARSLASLVKMADRLELPSIAKAH